MSLLKSNMNCKHTYYVLEPPDYYNTGYRMFCRRCLFTFIINVPSYIHYDQVREYLRLYVIKANTRKDFIL